MTATSGRRRQPHRLILKKPASLVLSFWTGQAAHFASNASAYEREGRLELALESWEFALLAPADAVTRAYCAERVRICGMDVSTEAIAA